MPGYVRRTQRLSQPQGVSGIPEHLNSWRKAIAKRLNVPPPPPIPYNFAVTGKNSGFLCTWTAPARYVKGVDGYEVVYSQDGTFNDAIVVSAKNANQTSLFITAGPTAVTWYFKLRATAGNLSLPQTVRSADTNTLAATSLVYNSAAAPVTVSENYLDRRQTNTNRGRYRDQ